MGVMVFWRQRLLGAELNYFLDKSHRSFDELKLLQKQLIQSEKLASLGQLVGGAAHEINNPLTAMLGYSDLLSASNLPAAEQQQAAKDRRTGPAHKNAGRKPADLRSPGARKTHSPSIPIPCSRPPCVCLQPQLEAQGITTRLELGPSLPHVLADSNQLLHVCRHLAGQIGGQFDSETHSALLVRTALEQNFVVIEFLTGAPSMHRPVCDTLLTSEGVNKPSTLSLSACSRIIEEHGGRLLRPSKTGVHAFRLELPIASKSALTQPRAAAHSAF